MPKLSEVHRDRKRRHSLSPADTGLMIDQPHRRLESLRRIAGGEFIGCPVRLSDLGTNRR